MTWELGENPDPFTQSENAGSVINRRILTNNRIKEPERIPVLQRRIVFAHHPKHRIGFLDEVAGFTNNCEFVWNWDVFGAGSQRELDDRQIEFSRFNCFL